MREEDFFRQVAQRLGRSEPLQSVPARSVAGAPEFWHNYELGYPERTQKFCSELEKLGGQTSLHSSLQSLQTGLRELLQQLAPVSIGLWGGDSLREFGLPDVLEGFQIDEWGAKEQASDTVERFASVEMGITGGDYAIADTGTIVVLAAPDKGRSVSLLPSIHVVVLRESQIVTRLGEVLAELEESRQRTGAVPSSVNFISGPSRSSDIENDLSIGVHGPAAVFVLLWQDAEA